MNNVKVLDCTLRDGGYINHWKFGKKTIKAIVDNLVSANIDIVETGFIRNVEYEENSSVFSSVDQIKEVITPKVQGTLYAAMIEQQNYDGNLISNYDGSSIDMIRLTFHKAEWEETKKTIIHDSDIIVINMSQRLRSINKFLELKKKNQVITSQKTLILIGRYDRFSEQSCFY